jgi:hypothetical protein
VSDPNQEVEQLYSATLRRIDAERGLVGWFRSRKTPWRRSILLATALLPAIVLVSATGTKLDAQAAVWARIAAVLGLESAAGVCLWIGLKPLQQPFVPRWVVATLTAAGLVAAFGAAIVEPPSGATQGKLHLIPAIACYVGGIVTGLPILFAALLLNRQANLARTLLSATGSGLAANVALGLVCRLGPAHVATAHATVGVTYVLTVLLASWLGRGGSWAASDRR